MRLRHATLAVVVLTALSVAGCGDDSDDKAPAAPAPTASVAPSSGVPAASAEAEAGTEASAGAAPTEGTSTRKPPKKGEGAEQGPLGKTP